MCHPRCVTKWDVGAYSRTTQLIRRLYAPTSHLVTHTRGMTHLKETEGDGDVRGWDVLRIPEVMVTSEV